MFNKFSLYVILSLNVCYLIFDVFLLCIKCVLVDGLHCADVWLTNNRHVIENRIINKKKESDRFASFMSTMFDSKKKNIGAIDCEFFYGASDKHIKKHIKNNANMDKHLYQLLPLYNIGICTPYTMNNILVKHPYFTIKQRFDIFKNKYNQDKMFKYLQNCVYYAIQMQTNINITKNELDLDTIEKYFELLALDYSQIMPILNKYCEQDLILLHHYCEADYTFIYNMCEITKFKQIDRISFQNTRQFCHVVFPINKVVSHSLSYFIDNIIKEHKKRPNDLHVAVYDAEMLLILFKKFVYLMNS